MKSVMVGSIAAILLAVVAGAVLNSLNPSAAEQFSTENARVK